MDASKQFVMDLSVLVCQDLSECTEVPVASQLLVYIPICNSNGTLPGNGTLAGVMDYFREDASQTAVDYFLQSLGINVSFFNSIQ